MIPTSAFVFWNYSASRLAKITAYATDGPWGHMGIGFYMSDGGVCYYEALRREGFVGPVDISRLQAFIDEDPHRRSCIVPLRLSSDRVCDLFYDCNRMVGHVGYSEKQLVWMALHERYHIPMRKSPGRVVCSEAVSRLVAPYGFELRDTRRTSHDLVNPNSAWRRMCEIMAGYGHVNAPRCG